jgi:integrase
VPTLPPTEDLFQSFRSELLARFETANAPVPIPFAAFQAELTEIYRPPMRAQATFGKMVQVLRAVADLLGPAGTTADLTPTLVARFISTRPATQGANTTISHLSYLRAACAYASASGYLRVSPFTIRRNWLRPAPPCAERKRHHSAEDIARVLDVAKLDVVRKVPGSWARWRAHRLYALISTVAYTGMRRTEALRLRVEDIDVPGRLLLVVSRNGSRLKTVGSAAPIPLPDALAAILADWLPNLALPDRPDENHFGPLPVANPSGIQDRGWAFPNARQTGPWMGGAPGYRPNDRFRAIGKRAGVTGLNFLSLRHSWATMAESLWGFSEPQIQRVLRHSTPRTQQTYRHFDPTNLKAACAGISFGNERTEPTAAVPPAVAPVPFVFAPPPPRPPAVPRRRSPNNGPKLSDADVLEMRELRYRGWNYTSLLLRYPVAKSTLHAALWGLTHRDVPMFGKGSIPGQGGDDGTRA